MEDLRGSLSLWTGEWEWWGQCLGYLSLQHCLQWHIRHLISLQETLLLLHTLQTHYNSFYFKNLPTIHQALQEICPCFPVLCPMRSLSKGEKKNIFVFFKTIILFILPKLHFWVYCWQHHPSVIAHSTLALWRSDINHFPACSDIDLISEGHFLFILTRC